jgi:hypothetical protein
MYRAIKIVAWWNGILHFDFPHFIPEFQYDDDDRDGNDNSGGDGRGDVDDIRFEL